MKMFSLYHPFTGKYVSNLVYDRRNKKKYNFQLTYNLNNVTVWKTRSGAEAQAQRIFACDRNVALEVKEIR